jgi:hypothetical protein
VGAAVGAGALVGSVVPGAGTVAGAVVGLIAGLGGWWLASQAQDAATKALIPEQTRKAYEAQTAYERQTQPIWYGVGELAPQFAAFKPNPKAIGDAFKLAGRISAAPMGEKLATLAGPKAGESIAEQLAVREHQDAVNQLLMMGFGSATTAYQAKQQVDAGDVQPLVLAANLVGSSLLSKPRWIKDVDPALRPGVDQTSQKGADNFVVGAGERSPAYAKAWQDHNDAIQSGDQAKIAETQARMDSFRQQAEQGVEAPIAKPEEAMPTDPIQAIAQQLKDEVNNAATPEERLKLAQEADAIAERQRIPNWESQVAKIQAEEQSKQGELEQQTNAMRSGVQQYQNSPYDRNPTVTGPEHQVGFQAAVDKFGLQPPAPVPVRQWTPEELQASIAANQAKTMETSRAMIKPITGQEPTPTSLPQHTQDVMRQLRQNDLIPLEEAYPTHGQLQQQAEMGANINPKTKAISEMVLADGQRFLLPLGPTTRGWKSDLMHEAPFGTSFYGATFNLHKVPAGINPKQFFEQLKGETNGIQQKTASVPQETGQVSSEAGVEASPATPVDATGSSEGGIGNAEAGADGSPTTGTGLVYPDAGNEAGAVGATDATAGNEPNAATPNATAGAAANAEATASSGSSSTIERGTTYGEQPTTGTAQSGSVNRGLNASAADPTVIKATADSLRAHLDQPGYTATPEEKTLLSVLDTKMSDLTRKPPAWPVPDPRLPEAVDRSLLNRTFKAVTQTQPIDGEGGRAYADRVVQATKVYKNLDHVLEVARGARDGFVELAQLPDGKVGFKIDGKLYKGTPSSHVANWDNGFRGVIHSILDNIPNELLATEPKDQSPIPIDVQQLKTSFADTFHPYEGKSTPPVEEKIEPSLVQPHDFAMSAHAADTPSLELNSASAANKIKAGLSQLQEHLDLVDDLAEHNPFNPEPIQKKFQELEQAAGGGSGLPPRPPGSGGSGEEPPQGGKSPDDQRQSKLEAQMAKTQKLEDNYNDALKTGLLTDDPTQKRIHAGINDILSSVLRTFDIGLWQKHPRVWVKEASDSAKSFAMYYKKINEDIKTRVSDLETQSPGAADRIRSVFTAGDDARPALLEQMAPDEAALANHLHTYWQLLGDILTRSGVIKSALEDYFPLIAEKPKLDGTMPGQSNSQRLASKTRHAMSRLRDEDGTLLFKTPEELQKWVDDNNLGWKVKTDLGDVLEAQGASVVKSLLMKHTVDQMMNNEFEINKYGESAPAILNQKMMDDNLVALDNSDQFIKGSKVIGPWQSALTRSKWLGDQRVPEDLWIRKDLAEQMSREATFKELGDNPIVRVLRWISNVNNYWKVFKFALTPMHAYSMLGNVSAHAGFAGTYGVVRRGADITNNPAMRSRFFQLMKASGSTEPVGEGLGGPHSVLNNIPGVGNFFKLQERLMWKTVGYNSLYGLGDKLSNEYMTMMAVKHPDVPVTQFEADKVGMDAAKKAVGYLDQLDMSKNYNLGANVLLLANRWTTGQLRTMGEAFSIKRLARIGNPVPMEGSSARASEFMQRRQVELSRRLMMGGMLRLFMVGTALSTVVSALHNNGVPSTPWDNFQKDPAHTFDIYMGRDSQTNRDSWVHMPFYLFQREMVDWAMAAVKAQEQGKPFIDPKNFGDSVLTAPFVRFAGKMNPVTKTSLEVATGQEIGQWMKGYDKAGIDSDQYILNLNKSLQKMNIPDQGSMENRFLYALRNLMPGINYPQNLPGATSDPWAVASAIAGLPFAGNQSNVELGFLGTRLDQGQAYTIGPNGQEVPTWQNKAMQDQKAAVGQQILNLASTLGTGTADEESQKFSQIEGLRQQGGFSPGQLVQLVEFGAGHNTGGQGLLYQNLPPKTAAQMTPAATIIDGRKLTPQEQVTYQGLKFQHEAFVIGQIMNDPSWKNMSASERSAAMNSAKTFVDKITDQQVGTSLGVRKGNVLNNAQAMQMIVSYGKLAKYTQDDLKNSAVFANATPEDQKLMLADRVSASQTAVWDKSFGTGVLKNATDAQLLNYVQLHSGVRDQARQLVNSLPTFTQSQNLAAKVAMLNSTLKFADTLVNQATAGKTLKTFDSPLAKQQISLAVRNGVYLQDAALKELHQSFIYQEAPTVDQSLLDQKYTNLAHNIALYDMRQGTLSKPDSYIGFDAALRTTLAADEGYQALVEQYFGMGGLQVLKAREAGLNDLKTRFRQENAIRPADLAHYDTMINKWYDQQNPDYAAFKHARTWWQANDPVGQAYHAVSQSNLGFESVDPLALATS